MKIALPIHGSRISPVFDVAERLVVVELEGEAERGREEAMLPEAGFLRRVQAVKDLGVGVLICGAISHPLELALLSEGVQVISQICGSVDEVLAAYQGRRLAEQGFLMPGCCGRRRGFGGRGHGAGPGRGCDRHGRGRKGIQT